ncbi:MULTISPECIES: hypothetical protein [unclassified Novosphingobium]|uniref:hypothetical protein n=1 Tax=unclassified Novosphingobium TaxID=2644732 RepID=UPI000D383592|nr:MULTISPECIES: hypothetical protein [unclassified Novosphingobium]
MITVSVAVGEIAIAAGFAIAWRGSLRRAAAYRRALNRAEFHVANLQRALGDTLRDADKVRAARKKANRAAMKAADAGARRQQTVDALAVTHLRPRAEVVAEVRARRHA